MKKSTVLNNAQGLLIAFSFKDVPVNEIRDQIKSLLNAGKTTGRDQIPAKILKLTITEI